MSSPDQVQAFVDEIEAVILRRQELSDIEIVGALHVIAHNAINGAYDDGYESGRSALEGSAPGAFLHPPEPEPPADMLPAHATAPERIWLNLMGAPEFLPFDDEGVIWSPEQIDETDVAYVRADLTQPAPEPSND